MLVPERKSWLVRTVSLELVLMSRQRDTICLAKSFDLQRKMLSAIIITPNELYHKIFTCKDKSDMLRDARRDIFDDAKVVLRCRAVILYSPPTLAKRISPAAGGYHCRRQYHSPKGEYN